VFESCYKPAQQGRKVAYLTVASFIFLAVIIGLLVVGNTQHLGPRPSNSLSLWERAPINSLSLWERAGVRVRQSRQPQTLTLTLSQGEREPENALRGVPPGTRSINSLSLWERDPINSLSLWERAGVRGAAR